MEKKNRTLEKKKRWSKKEVKATKDPTVDNKIKFKKEKKKAKSTVWLKRRKIKKSSENVGSKSLKKTKTQEGKLENVTQCTGGKIWLLLELMFFPFSFLLILEKKIFGEYR